MYDKIFSPPAEEQPKEWSKDPNDYELGELIGRGGFGKVYVGKTKSSDTTIAIKKITISQKNTFIDIMNEAEISAVLQHENVVNIYTYFVVKNEVLLVMEMMNIGSLAGLIPRDNPNVVRNDPVMSEKIIICIISQILKGLKFIHASGFVHCDIKPQNILINNKGIIKIADFGLTKKLEDLNELGNARGTLFYMAPELIEKNEYTYKCDIWALGIMLIELISGKPLYVNEKDQLRKLLEIKEKKSVSLLNLDSQLRKSFSHDFDLLLSKCLQYDHESRANAEDLLSLSIIQNTPPPGYLCYPMKLKFRAEGFLKGCAFQRYTTKSS